jgi:hypothetical protein
MTTFHVFDRPMCCATGVCGPEVDPQLVQFAADLEWLKRHGIEVVRHNLAQHPGEFAATADVLAVLRTEGTETLPLFWVNGALLFRGSYPSRQQMALWCGVATAELPVIDTPCPVASGCC